MLCVGLQQMERISHAGRNMSRRSCGSRLVLHLGLDPFPFLSDGEGGH